MVAIQPFLMLVIFPVRNLVSLRQNTHTQQPTVAEGLFLLISGLTDVCMSHHTGFEYVDDAMNNSDISDFCTSYMDEVCHR